MGEPERKRPLLIPGHRWEEDIKWIWKIGVGECGVD